MTRRKSLQKLLVAALLIFVGGGVANVAARVIPYKGPDQEPTVQTEAGNHEDPAIVRTRKQIQMLDDLYKTAVVLITEHYVHDPSTLLAASASKALFAAMKDKGWHDARLLGFTDLLFKADENSPQDQFEQTAQEKLLAGAPSHEAIVTKNGKRYLRVATPIPVVMEKCVMCHANFKGKAGAIGALSYTVPVVE